eukprot:gene2649-biopygen980
MNSEVHVPARPRDVHTHPVDDVAVLGGVAAEVPGRVRYPPAEEPLPEQHPGGDDGGGELVEIAGGVRDRAQDAQVLAWPTHARRRSPIAAPAPGATGTSGSPPARRGRGVRPRASGAT